VQAGQQGPGTRVDRLGLSADGRKPGPGLALVLGPWSAERAGKQSVLVDSLTDAGTAGTVAADCPRPVRMTNRRGCLWSVGGRCAVSLVESAGSYLDLPRTVRRWTFDTMGGSAEKE
jgi:hypothetical protein